MLFLLILLDVYLHISFVKYRHFCIFCFKKYTISVEGFATVLAKAPRVFTYLQTHIISLLM